jgi:hypothetical protein
MANAGLGRLGYHIPGRLYARWFITAAFFDEVVLLMDCCRDDYPRARMYTPPWEEIRTPRAAEVRYLYAFATEWSRKSREKLFPEGNEEQVQGLFTRSILAGLSGQARDEQARITTASLKKFVLNHLPGLLEKDERQEPKFEFNDEIVFLENLPLMRTQVRIAFQQPDKDGQVVLFGPTRQFLGQHSAQDGTWKISLEQGMHELFSLNTCRQTFFEVLGGEILDVQF